MRPICQPHAHHLPPPSASRLPSRPNAGARPAPLRRALPAPRRSALAPPYTTPLRHRARNPSMARRSLVGDATAGAASRVTFAPTSNNVLVSSWNSGLRLYDADEGTLRVNAESKDALLDCCFEDESTAFACGSDGSVRRYIFDSGSHYNVGLHDDALTCIEFSLMTGQVITGSLNKKLKLWDPKTRNVSPSGTMTLDSNVASLSIFGMYILAAVQRDVYLYDMRDLTRPVHRKDCPLEYQIQCLHSSQEWKAYVAGSVDGVVALEYLDHDTDRDLGYSFRCHPKSRNGRSNLVPINCIAVHPCNRTFITGDDDGCTITWDAQSKKKLIEFPTYLGSVASMAYNCNGQLLAVASNYFLEVDKKEHHHQVFIETVKDFKGKSHMG